MAKLRVLIDSNIWINAVDKGEEEYMEKLELYLDPDSDYDACITPLIRHEVLRKVDWGDNERIKEALNR